MRKFLLRFLGNFFWFLPAIILISVFIFGCCLNHTLLDLVKTMAVLFFVGLVVFGCSKIGDYFLKKAR